MPSASFWQVTHTHRFLTPASFNLGACNDIAATQPEVLGCKREVRAHARHSRTICRDFLVRPLFSQTVTFAVLVTDPSPPPPLSPFIPTALPSRPGHRRTPRQRHQGELLAFTDVSCALHSSFDEAEAAETWEAVRCSRQQIVLSNFLLAGREFLNPHWQPLVQKVQVFFKGFSQSEICWFTTLAFTLKGDTVV